MALQTGQIIKLSGSTDGQQIKITQTVAGSADTIHTAHANSLDELYITATNTSASAVVLTVLWGGTTSPDDYQYITIPPQTGNVVICWGDRALTNSKVVKMFAASANVINITGKVIRIANV